MALVGPITIEGSTGNSNWAFKTVVTEIATDNVKKTSTVKVENFLGRTNSSSYFMGNYDLNFEVDGQKYSTNLYKSSGTIPAGNFVSLGSHTFEIEQTTTPLTINVKGSYSNAGFSPSSASASGKVTLSKLHEAPVIDDIVWEEINPVLSSTGIDGNYFIPHLSIKKATISSLLYDNATLKETKIINENNIYKSTPNEPNVVTIDLTKNALYTQYIEHLNQNVPKLSVSLTDDTGSTSEWAWPYTYYIPYTKPNLVATSSNVKRNGQVSGKATLNINGTFYNTKIGNKNNSVTVAFKYWKKGTTEPATYYNIPSNEYTISGNNISIKNWNVAKDGTIVSDLDKSSVYLFKIKCTDVYGSVSSEIILTCPKGEWLMAKFKDRIDFKKITINSQNIIESAKNENGSYIKYYDGTLICRGTHTINTSNWSASGSLYYYDYQQSINFPTNFANIDDLSVEISSNNSGYVFWCQGVSFDANSITKVNLLRTSPANNSQITISYIAIGKWK